MAGPESGQRELVSEARAAAVAASSIVTQHIVDMSGWIGALGARQGGQRQTKSAYDLAGRMTRWTP
jgi:hypothetical protein